MATAERQPVRYVATPETEVTIDSFGGDVARDVDAIADAIVVANGLKWDSMAGFGGFFGLSSKLTAKFEKVAPECDPRACNRHIEVSIEDGRPENATLRIECPRISQPTQAAADAKETTCLANHEAVKSAFPEYVTATAVAISQAREAIADAQQQIRTNELNLLDLVK